MNLKYFLLLSSVILHLINYFFNNEFLFTTSIALAFAAVVYDEFTMFDKKEK